MLCSQISNFILIGDCILINFLLLFLSGKHVNYDEMSEILISTNILNLTATTS